MLLPRFYGKSTIYHSKSAGITRIVGYFEKKDLNIPTSTYYLWNLDVIFCRSAYVPILFDEPFEDQ